MEILSTGEKIKRCRVYKGITLKELCGDKISISKMSCIENGKIKADKESLKYIAEKLEVDYEYLVRDVYEQIKYNIEDIKSSDYSIDKLEEIINYNLEYSFKYQFNDLSLDLTHTLFQLYMDNNKFENIHGLIAKYYDLYKTIETNEETIIYYNDIATFFMKTEEYHEAISYFSRVIDIYKNNDIKDKTKYIYACFYEGICYKNIKMVDKAYECLSEILIFDDIFTGDKDRGEFYHEFAILNILLQKNQAQYYLDKALKYKRNDKKDLAEFKGVNAKVYFKVNQPEEALKELKEAIEIYPRENQQGYAEFLMECISILYDNKKYEEVLAYIEEAVNLAIFTNDSKLIEKGYYFKGMVYQRKGDLIHAEMYMNLSTDFLLKFANNEEKYKRYNEMAELYYNLGELKESIKYFTLAINIQKKL